MTSLPKCLVLQSHQSPLPFPWLRDTLNTVKSWAKSLGYDYQCRGDDLFELLPRDIYHKTRQQRVVASDLARLLGLRQALRQGYDCAIWCDADFLIFAPDDLQLPSDSYALGREVWIQRQQGRLKALTKVHNAFLMFRNDNPFLDFYIHAAERLISRHDGQMVPQLAGPKFLTAIHNMLQCPVLESAAAFSPLVIKDLLNGSGPALDLLAARSHQQPAAANLCASSVRQGELRNKDMASVIESLLTRSAMPIPGQFSNRHRKPG